MKPAAASAILAKLEAITRQWKVINERLDHMGVLREQVGYPDTRQDEDRSSCELRGKNVIPYTYMNVVAVLPSVGVPESSFCDTLDIVRSHEDQTLVVGTQELVDPLDDEIDSPRKNDLCPSGASTYNLTKVPLPSDESIHTLVDPCDKKGESTLECELPTTSEDEKNDQPGIDDLDLLEYLENPSCDCLCEDDFDYGPLASRDGLYVCEDNSRAREGDMCVEMPSISSLCVSYVGHIPSGNFETSNNNDKDYTNHSVMLRISQQELNLKECPIMEETNLDYHMKNSGIACVIEGSVNGLICLVNEEKELFLWNPAIRKYKKLPDFRTKLKDDGQCTYGFGYDDIHDDYKSIILYVNRLILGCNVVSSDHSLHKADLLSLNTSTGKTTSFPISFINPRIQTNSAMTTARLLNSSSAELLETVVCFFDF
ncbi:hypothetical protein BC332_20080 [Capsicum chinense]|nr:hypothetical protein BC332_20080 [Capsicum chinense]